jgi:hypothetical protein
MDYHTTYRGPEGRTTEWDDIQVKLGNYPARPKRETAPKFEGEVEQVKDHDWVRRLDEDELAEIEDELEDDRALKVLRCASGVLAGPSCQCPESAWHDRPSCAESSALNNFRRRRSNHSLAR